MISINLNILGFKVDMPIIIKDFEWSESVTKLDIVIPQKGVKSSKIDVMVTPLYIKVDIIYILLKSTNIISKCFF